MVLQELGYLPCALPYKFIFSSNTDYMTLGGGGGVRKNRWHILVHGALAGNSPVLDPTGQKGVKIVHFPENDD